ncbi:MAG: hypothetical protein ACRDMV_11025 [Streptosporangiales bacterium]
MRTDCASLAGIYIHGARGVVAITRWSRGSYAARFGRARMTSGHATDRAMVDSPVLRALLTATPHSAETHAVTTSDVSTVRGGLGPDAAALSWHVAPSVAGWLNLVETLLYLTLRTEAGRPAAGAAPRAVSKIMNAVEPLATGRGAADDWFSWTNGGVAGGESGPAYAGAQ